jgi:hypothetical protein
MIQLFALALLSINVLGQNLDPWSGSGCDVNRFCNYECAINATQAQNITTYRMTPLGVYELTDKNTGDIPGDTSFVLS